MIYHAMDSNLNNIEKIEQNNTYFSDNEDAHLPNNKEEGNDSDTFTRKNPTLKAFNKNYKYEPTNNKRNPNPGEKGSVSNFNM